MQASQLLVDHLRDNHPHEHARWGSAVDVLLQLSSPEALSGAAHAAPATSGAQTSSEVSEQHAPAATDSSGSRLGVWAASSQPAAVSERPGLAVPGAQTSRVGEAMEAALDPAVLAAAAAAQGALLQHGRRSKSPAQATPRCTSSNSVCNHTLAGRVHVRESSLYLAKFFGQDCTGASVAAWDCALEQCSGQQDMLLRMFWVHRHTGPVGVQSCASLHAGRGDGPGCQSGSHVPSGTCHALTILTAACPAWPNPKTSACQWQPAPWGFKCVRELLVLHLKVP